MAAWKKAAAMTLSAVLLLQPMTASAVTWGNIVNGLRNSGTNRYTEDGTTIEKDGDNYTVTGGTIENNVILDKNYFDGLTISFKGITVDGRIIFDGKDGNTYAIETDANTKVRYVVVNAENGTHVKVTNKGIVEDRMYGTASGENSRLEFINEGTSASMVAHSFDGSSAKLQNDGFVESMGGSPEGNTVYEIVNGENGTVTDEIYTISHNGANVEIKNLGKTKDFFIISQDADIRIINNGEAERSHLFIYDVYGRGGNMEFENNGKLGNKESDSPYLYTEVIGKDSKLNIVNNGTVESSTAEGVEGNAVIVVGVPDEATKEEVLAQLNQIGLSNKEGNYNILLARYRWEKTGEDEFNEIITGYELINYNDAVDQPEEPEQPTFEVSKYDQERHEMEEKRKEEAIGGVYGSPYWVRQLYLGYHSLNLRLFIGEKQANFKEDLSWMPDSTKQLTLRVNTDTPEKLAMRLDEKALETLERTNFSVITLTDRDGTPVMQYSLADLRSAYDQYGLHDADQIVVGGADDDVMKIVDGEMKPIEE